MLLLLVLASVLSDSRPLSLTEVEVLERAPMEWLEAALTRTEVPSRAEVLVKCDVAGDGWLRNCVANDVDDHEAIWAEIATAFCEQTRVSARTRNGQPTVGRTVTIPLRIR